MFNNKSKKNLPTKNFWTVSRKIILPISAIVVLGIGGLVGYNYYQNNLQEQAQLQIELQQLEFSAEDRINGLETLALGLATETANNPAVQAAFATNDREKLQDLMLPTFDVVNAEFAVKQYVFHLPPATAFLRLHQLDKFGDDLSTIRATVIQANATKEPVHGIEIGRGGLGIRGVVPVIYEGKHIGVVDVGIDIGPSFLEEFKQIYGVDAQFLIAKQAADVVTFTGFVEGGGGPTDDLLLQASTLTEPVYTDVESYQRALSGESVVSTLDVNGRNYYIVSFPIRDFSDNIVGVVDLISDQTAFVAQHNKDTNNSILLTLVLVLVSGVALTQITNYFLRPVGAMTEAVNLMTGGDLTQRVKVTSDDEFGILANGFNNMTERLQEMVTNLENRVADRTKALVTSAEISRRLTSILDPNELASEVVNEVQTAFNYYYAQIYLFDAENKNLVLTAGTGDAGAEMMKRGHALPKGRGLVGRAAETNKSVLVEDTSQDPEWLPNKLLPETKTEVAVPISVGGKVLGVLDIQNSVTNSITSEDVDLLESLAGQVAISLQNAESYARAEAALQDNQSLLEYAAEGIAILDLETELWAEPNENFARTFGMTQDEMVTTGPKVMSPPTQPDGRDSTEKAIEMINTAMEKGSHRFEWVHLKKDGTEFDCEIGLVRMPGERPRLRQSLLDITERKRLAESTAKKAREQEMLNTISQKIQNTTTIEAALQMTARELGVLFGKRQTFVALDVDELNERGKVAANE